MLERLLIVAIFSLLAVAAAKLYMRWQLKRVSANINADPILQDSTLGVPTIVYFTTPFCLPCKTQQQPALKKLRETSEFPVQIVEVDATEDPEAADRWGVLSAPTTFVLDADGQPHIVNHGVADERKLTQQIEQAMQTA